MITSKARRVQDRKVIREVLNDPNNLTPDQPISRTFRLVIYTQYRENYGAHNEPPVSYWKSKGGNEYKYPIGSALDVIRLGSKGIQELIRQAQPDIEHADFYSQEHIIDWAIYGDLERTEDEEMDYWYSSEYGHNRAA